MRAQPSQNHPFQLNYSSFLKSFSAPSIHIRLVYIHLFVLHLH
jgi:hypothetical protein